MIKLSKTKIDRPFLSQENYKLLGDWCLDNDGGVLQQRHFLPKVKYHWDDKTKYNLDFYYLDALYETVLDSLSSELNKIHAVDKQKKYWRIIIGPWLRSFIEVLFDRFESVKHAVRENPEAEVIIFDYNLVDFCPEDSAEFWENIRQDRWNEVIFSECCKFLEIPFESGDLKLENKKNISTVRLNLRLLRKKLLFMIHDYYAKYVGPRLGGVICVGAYISLKDTIKLQIKIGQWPYLKFPKFDFGSVTMRNKAIRNNLGSSFQANNSFEKFLVKKLGDFLPAIFLENFSKAREQVKNNLPDKVEKIFTANFYHIEEEFKIWSAEKSTDGAALIVGQHGGNFGVGLINQSELHQKKIADKFVTWGWDSANDKNLIKMPSLQLSSAGSILRKIDGNILHVLASPGRYFYQHFSIPSVGHGLNHLQDQLSFLEGLNSNAIQRVKVRLDLSAKSHGWDISKILTQAGFSSHIEDPKKSLESSLKNARLCVCTHNATVFLQTLSMNFPTIIFWNPDHYEIRPDAVKYFDSLKDAGILHFDPVQAASLANSIYQDVDKWWSSSDLQKARAQFCERFAKQSINWLREWSSFLRVNSDAKKN